MEVIRDRIKSLRRVKAGLLKPSPKNWREHPQAQQDALRGILSEVGYAGALLARELPDKSLELIDGHLRADLDPNQKVPVLILDVTEAEASKLLAVIDPMAAMAEANEEALTALLAEIETDNEGLSVMLDGLTQTDPAPPEVNIDIGEIAYRVVVDVENESEQAKLIRRLEEEGMKCQPLMS